MSLLAAALLLFLVFDPLGNTPLFVVVLEAVPPTRRRRVILREMGIALGVLVLFLFVGEHILRLLHIETPTLPIAGGIILFLIALRMIFPTRQVEVEELPQEPLVVPLAVPLIAGPSAVATLLLLVSQWPDRRLQWLAALLLAWAGALIILLIASTLTDWLGHRVLRAFERLMGLVLVTIAVQMFLDGLEGFVRSLGS